MCSAIVQCAITYNMPPFRNKWGDFLTRAFTPALYRKVFAFWRKRAAISICEKGKEMVLVSSQTGVILLASLLLLLSSYLISGPPWLGGFVGEENEETAFMVVFFPFSSCSATRDIESLSWYTYDSPYFIHLFVSSNYSKRENTPDTEKQMTNRWQTWATLM